MVWLRVKVSRVKNKRKTRNRDEGEWWERRRLSYHYSLLSALLLFLSFMETICRENIITLLGWEMNVAFSAIAILYRERERHTHTSQAAMWNVWASTQILYIRRERESKWNTSSTPHTNTTQDGVMWTSVYDSSAPPFPSSVKVFL